MTDALRLPARAPRTGVSKPFLQVRDLTVELRNRGQVALALDGVSLSVDRGETLALLGESGSGKSMTALALMGLVPPRAGRITGGQVLVDGLDLRSLSPKRLAKLRGQRLAMVFQDPLSSLNPVMTVGYQIGEMFRRHQGASRAHARARAIELMERVSIPDAANRVDNYPHQFSGGMRQRVLIAVALALSPEVLIADEPTTALDVTVQTQIMQLLADLQREEQMALILISHDLGTVADVADRVAVMYGGRIVESGPTRQVYQHSAHPYTRGLLASLPSKIGKGERLVPIAGAPPSLFALPSGCAFHPRCPYRQDRCVTEVPPRRQLHLVPDSTGAQVGAQDSACHFAEDVRRGRPPVARPAPTAGQPSSAGEEDRGAVARGH